MWSYTRLEGYINRPYYFSGLNSGQFGAEVELTGGTVYVGAPGLSRLYWANVGDGGYGHWSTNFGTPLRATGYGGGYGGINEIVNNGGFQWSGTDNSMAASPNGARFISSDPYGDYDSGNGGSTIDTGASFVYVNGGYAGQFLSGDNSIKLFGLAPAFPAKVTTSSAHTTPTASSTSASSDPRGLTPAICCPMQLPTAKFGSSVAIDGMTAIVGARDYDYRGAAFVFVRDGVEAETWSLQAKLQGLDTNKNDWFGSAVGVSGNTAIVGAAKANDDVSGAAYIFERIGDVWIQQAKLLASGQRGESTLRAHCRHLGGYRRGRRAERQLGIHFLSHRLRPDSTTKVYGREWLRFIVGAQRGYARRRFAQRKQ